MSPRALEPEYRTWKRMKGRCYDPSHDAFKHYGGRGITVCQRWIADYPAFLQDMGPRPSPAHSIDRIDVNGNYEPSNCRWATKKVQSRNTRQNVAVRRSDGVVFSSMSEAAEVSGIHYAGISHACYGRRPSAGGFTWSLCENTHATKGGTQ